MSPSLRHPVTVQSRVRSRGREEAIGRVVTVDDLASLVAMPRRVLVWHCERAAKLGKGSLFFGVWQEGEQWFIPRRVVMRVCSGWPLQHYTVRQVCELMGCSERYLRARICKVPAGMDIEAARPAGNIGARLLFGSDLRIPESEVARLAAGFPNHRPVGENGADDVAGENGSTEPPDDYED